MELAREVLRRFRAPAGLPRARHPAIQKAVAQHFDIPLETLKAKTRIARVVLARQVAMYLARDLTEAVARLESAQLFGDRDHSTVLHACTKVKRRSTRPSALRRKVQAIQEELSS